MKNKYEIDTTKTKTEDDLRKVLQPSLVQSIVSNANIESLLKEEYD